MDQVFGREHSPQTEKSGPSKWSQVEHPKFNSIEGELVKSGGAPPLQTLTSQQAGQPRGAAAALGEVRAQWADGILLELLLSQLTPGARSACVIKCIFLEKCWRKIKGFACCCAHDTAVGCCSPIQKSSLCCQIFTSETKAVKGSGASTISSF